MLMHSIKMTIHLLLKKEKRKKKKKEMTIHLLPSTKSSQLLSIQHELLSSVTTIHILPSKIGIWKQNSFFVT